MGNPTKIHQLTREQLIDALQRVQHFCPPRVTRQDKETLVSAVARALGSQLYYQQMVEALAAAGMHDMSAYLSPRKASSGYLNRPMRSEIEAAADKKKG